jgi:hypothetical protein
VNCLLRSLRSAPLLCRSEGGLKTNMFRHYSACSAAWKDADPDIPILKEAKAEYAKLQ